MVNEHLQCENGGGMVAKAGVKALGAQKVQGCSGGG